MDFGGKYRRKASRLFLKRAAADRQSRIRNKDPYGKENDVKRGDSTKTNRESPLWKLADWIPVGVHLPCHQTAEEFLVAIVHASSPDPRSP